MPDTGLYDTDLIAWSEQQEAALRELAARRDLPNALDLPHIIEEIADLGQSELNAVNSFIGLIISSHGNLRPAMKRLAPQWGELDKRFIAS